jgi:hypothetical protein
MARRDPDARCGTCDVRLARVDADHEDRCSREADGWPPFEDHAGEEIETSGDSGSGDAGVAGTIAETVQPSPPVTHEARDAA